MTDFMMEQKHVSREVFNAFIDRMLEKENQKYINQGSEYRTDVINDIDVYYDGTYLYGDVRIEKTRGGDISDYKEACKIFYEVYGEQ